MDKNTAELMQPVKRHMESYLNEWIGEHNTDVAQRLKNISSAMYRMEEELERCSEGDLAGLVHSGADSMEEISNQVAQGEARDLMEILEQQGRNHPAGALLASMTAGFLSTRAIGHKSEGAGDQGQQAQAPEQQRAQAPGQRAQAQHTYGSAQAQTSPTASGSSIKGDGDGTSKTKL